MFSESLRDFICSSMRDIAPEKAEDFETLSKEAGMTLRWEDDGQRFRTDLESKTIFVAGKRLQRLWAMSYAYFLCFEAMEQAWRQGRTSISLEETQDLGVARSLLSWAVRAHRAYKKGLLIPPIPEHLPHPDNNAPPDSNVRLATRLFWGATAFILHHEFAHIRLGHEENDNLAVHDRIRQEKEADNAAAEWLLNGLDDNSREFQFRALAVALGLLLLLTLRLHSGGTFQSKSHPPAYDRVYQVLARFVSDPNNQPWAFVLVALLLHLESMEVPHEPDVPFESFQGAVNALMNLIANPT